MQVAALSQAGQSSPIPFLYKRIGRTAHTLTGCNPRSDWSRIMMRPIVILLAGFFVTCGVWLTGVDQAGATTYYVDKAGSDNNSCANAASASSNRSLARLTIGSHMSGTGGLDCARAPGDTVIVGDGTYVEAERQFSVNGTLANPITLRAEHKWLAILSSISSCNPNISSHANYSVVDGLSLVINAANVYCSPNSASGTGVRLWGDGTGGVVRNIKTDDPTGPSGKIRSHGIKSNQHNSIIEDNELAAGLETLLADNAIIRRNHITGGGNWNNGIVTKGGGKNVQVYNNVIDAPSMVGGGIILGGANASDNPPQECFNCVAWNNVVRISPNGIGLDFQGCKDCAFFNNVAFGGSFGMDTAPSSSNINNTWRNNILDCQGSNATQNLQGSYTIDFNNIFNCSGTPSQAHPIIGNPQFVDPQSDWHLSLGSPAIGSGTLVSFIGFSGAVIDVSKDADGLLRTIPWSLGRYRSVGTTDITPPLAPAGLVVN